MCPIHELPDLDFQDHLLRGRSSIQDPYLSLPYSPMTWFKVKFLGSGSYGTVNLAISANSGSSPGLLAVKSAIVKRSSTLMKEEKILQEFVNCPEVVRCLGSDFSFEDGQWSYNLLMEYASGGTLHDLIQKSGGKFLESDVQKYTRMIIKGLCSIHEKGYVHCDLKPDNILVFHSPNGTRSLKIADFGLSKVPGEENELKPREFHFRGAPLYMSPESILLGEIQSSLDIWSLGCIVVEMISGKRVWDFKGEEALMIQIVTGSPKIPETMSEIGKDFLRKCFERETAKRWTAEMLLHHPFLIETEVLPPAISGFGSCLSRSGNPYSSEKLPPPPGFESIAKNSLFRRNIPPPPGFDPIPKRPVICKKVSPPPGFDPIPKRPVICKKLPPPGFFFHNYPCLTENNTVASSAWYKSK